MIARFTLALLLAACGGSPALAATRAATPATFAAVLAAAQSGDTIDLGAGDYGVLSVVRRDFTPPLVITGFDATVRGVYVAQSSGVTFRGLSIEAGPAADADDQAVRVWIGQRIVIEASTIIGGLATGGVPASTKPKPAGPGLDATGNVIGLPSGKGVNLYQCRDCRLTGNFIGVFHKGIVFGGSDGLTIDRNTIENLRTTPISGVPGANLTITDNITRSSHPWRYSGPGDHGDRLHLWTAGRDVTGLRVTGNQFLQGDGYPMIGILIQNLDGKFVGAVISGNTVETAVGQGITLGGVSGTVANNTLIWSRRGASGVGVAPYIYVQKSSRNLTVTGTRGGKVNVQKGAPASVVVRP